MRIGLFDSFLNCYYQTDEKMINSVQLIHLITMTENYLYPLCYPRTVLLARDDKGHLGISIKGGKEHNLPILVSRVTSSCMQAR